METDAAVLEPEPEVDAPECYDRYGLVLGSEHAIVYPHEHDEETKEVEREVKWRKMLGAWDHYAGADAIKRRKAKLKRRVRKGIPQAYRGRVWFLLSDAYQQMKAHHLEYQDLAFTKPCPDKVEQQIRLDIGRTITDHAFFRDLAATGQQSLYRVLRAYAVFNHKVGYCQGMSYVAGMFLCQGVNEEEAFWMLRQFMNSERYNLCGLYEDGFPLMQRYLENLTELLRQQFPACYAHCCERCGVAPVMFAEKWLLTLFMYNWPYKIALRIWDVIMYEGPTSFFCFALTVFDVAQAVLLRMDTEQLLLFLTGNSADGGFKRIISQAGIDAFIELALKNEVKPETLRAIEKRSSQRLRQRVALTAVT